MQPMQPLSQQQDILEDEARQKPGFPPLARLGLGIGILVTGYILLRLGGGFPPQSWKLLYATFAGRGAPAPNPDLVIIQSVILLAAWLLLLLVAIQIVRPGRKTPSFSEEEQEALAAQPARVALTEPPPLTKATPEYSQAEGLHFVQPLFEEAAPSALEQLAGKTALPKLASLISNSSRDPSPPGTLRIALSEHLPQP